MFRQFAYTIAAVGLLCLSQPALADVVEEVEISPVIAEVGKAAPDFSATDVNGADFSLSSLKGKLVILEWTNHQCPYVIKHYDSGNMQKTQAAAKKHGAEWITIVSSAPGRQGHTAAQEAKDIAEKSGAKITTKILDESGSVGKLYGAKATPHMYIVNQEGILVYAGAIDNKPSPRKSTVETATNYVLAALDNIAAGQPIETPVTSAYGCAVKYAY